jgi:hypothetical protein
MMNLVRPGFLPNWWSLTVVGLASLVVTLVSQQVRKRGMGKELNESLLSRLSRDSIPHTESESFWIIESEVDRLRFLAKGFDDEAVHVFDLMRQKLDQYRWAKNREAWDDFLGEVRRAATTMRSPWTDIWRKDKEGYRR